MSAVGLPPGFRFHPTDEELVNYYLKRKINGQHIELDIIPEVDLYKCEPWELSEKSFLPSRDPEWYFFGPRDRKYPNGFRTNRATKAGYWKSTGKDRRVNSHNKAIGMKKTLVYYRGRAPQGIRTDWVMHEYRLDDKDSEDTCAIQDSYALCRVFKKNGICTETEDQQAQSINISIMEGGGLINTNNNEYHESILSSPDNFQINPSSSSYNFADHDHDHEEVEEEDKDDSWMQFITDHDPTNWSTSSSNILGDDVSHLTFTHI
ncbi:NAC domain-containing protein 86 [Euphorbia lathyris]|uniref:NAC domain-containing protein 86 n=1 Tax=Euphorbia lathyris TaxID=212925 RepID=UPI0033137016